MSSDFFVEKKGFVGFKKKKNLLLEANISLIFGRSLYTIELDSLPMRGALSPSWTCSWPPRKRLCITSGFNLIWFAHFKFQICFVNDMYFFQIWIDRKLSYISAFSVSVLFANDSLDRYSRAWWILWRVLPAKFSNFLRWLWVLYFDFVVSFQQTFAQLRTFFVQFSFVWFNWGAWSYCRYQCVQESIFIYETHKSHFLLFFQEFKKTEKICLILGDFK